RSGVPLPADPVAERDHPRPLRRGARQPRDLRVPAQQRDRVGHHRGALGGRLDVHGLRVLEVPLRRPQVAHVLRALEPDVPAGAAARDALPGVRAVRSAQHLPRTHHLVHDVHAAAVRVDAEGLLRRAPRRPHRGGAHRRRGSVAHLPLGDPAARGPRPHRIRTVRLRARLERLHLRAHPRGPRQADAAAGTREHLHQRGQHLVACAHGRIAARVGAGVRGLHPPSALPRRRSDRRCCEGLIPSRNTHPQSHVRRRIMTIELSRRDLLRYSAIGIGGAALFGLAGCAPAGSPNAPSTGGTAADFAFGSWGLSEDATKPVLEAAVDGFASSKKVDWTPVTYPYNDYLNQLTLQVRGGQFAGAAQLDVAWIAALAALGKLTDLSSLTTGRGYTSAGLGAGKVDGTQYGLPWTIGAIGPVANQELFDKAGASLEPQTIEEFEEGLRA